VDLYDGLQWLQVAAFVALALAAIRQWQRQRTRPSAYLAAAFVAIAVALVWRRVIVADQLLMLRQLRSLDLVGYAVFPWLLAAFSWSFQGRLPRTLRIAAVPVAAMALWGLLVPPFTGPDGGPAPTHQMLYVDAFAAGWTVLSLTTAWHLWRSGGPQRVVRARMRLMAGGVFVMNVALLGAAASLGSGPLAAVTSLTAITAAGLFLAGFAPPQLLRLWWRRTSGGEVHDLYTGLIGAATPEAIARAVVPAVADLTGGGVVVIAEDGEVLAVSGLPDELVTDIQGRLAGQEPLGPGYRIFHVGRGWLVVRTDPYMPVFGREELELVGEFSLQLRLALERAELFEAHLAAQAAADRAAEELEATLVGLAHDLRSPTAAIAGFAALLGEVDSVEQRAEIVAQIRRSSRYVDELVGSLLEFAGVGRTQLELEPVDLGAVVATVAGRVAVTDPGAVVVIEGRLPVVLVNPVRIEQVVDNLVTNAVKHAGRGDVTVRVGVESEEQGVVLVVADDGRGIASEDRERVFALFQRGRGADRDGSGVGLGMVRRIAESYGGSVRVADAPQGGARIEVVLPAALVVDGSDQHGSAIGRVRTTTDTQVDGPSEPATEAPADRPVWWVEAFAALAEFTPA
jgi:signal transduction histidine kinase